MRQQAFCAQFCSNELFKLQSTVKYDSGGVGIWLLVVLPARNHDHDVKSFSTRRMPSHRRYQ